jgi:HEAT repeat protein
VKDDNLRSQSVNALFALGPAGQTVAASALKHEDAKLRTLILTSMKKDGYRTKEAVPVLIGCLKDRSAEVRALSADVLGAVGTDAGPAIAPLTIALEDTDPTVRSSVRNALSRIGPSGK